MNEQISRCARDRRGNAGRSTGREVLATKRDVSLYIDNQKQEKDKQNKQGLEMWREIEL